MSKKFWKHFRSLLAFSTLSLHCQGSPNPSAGTAPFVLDANRMYAEVAFVRPDGTLHKTLAFVDLGSPSMILTEALLKELRGSRNKNLIFKVGEMPVRIDSGAVTSDTWLPFSIGDHRKVEAVLPAGIMQQYEVVIDYAQGALTLAQPGTLKPKGTPVRFRANQKTGLIAVDVSINGKTYPVALDNGSAYTWLRKSAAQQWLAVHPDWQRGVGAVGLSNMRMADDGIEAAGIVLRIPEIRLGPLHLRRIGALAIGPSSADGDFLDWYSQKTPVPVIGWLGGNVLKGFCITLDYRNRISYWLPQTEPDAHDLDQVGLTLKRKHGEYLVAAVATQNGKPAVEGIRVGDELLQIGALHTDGTPWSAVLAALHGKPGELRTLVFERNGSEFKVQAKIMAF